MSDRLKEALTQYLLRGATTASEAAKAGIGTDMVHILAAARRWEALDSDENVEVVAKLICDMDVDFGVKWADLDEHYNDQLAASTRDEFRFVARVALQAVKAGEGN